MFDLILFLFLLIIFFKKINKISKEKFVNMTILNTFDAKMN